MITSNGKSIVVVDDERDIVNQIKRSLESMDGLKVYAYTDPFAALYMIGTESLHRLAPFCKVYKYQFHRQQEEFFFSSFIFPFCVFCCIF